METSERRNQISIQKNFDLSWRIVVFELHFCEHFELDLYSVYSNNDYLSDEYLDYRIVESDGERISKSPLNGILVKLNS